MAARGRIAGAVIASLAATTLLLLVFWLALKRRNRTRRSEKSNALDLADVPWGRRAASGKTIYQFVPPDAPTKRSLTPSHSPRISPMPWPDKGDVDNSSLLPHDRLGPSGLVKVAAPILPRSAGPYSYQNTLGRISNLSSDLAPPLSSLRPTQPRREPLIDASNSLKIPILLDRNTTEPDDSFQTNQSSLDDGLSLNYHQGVLSEILHQDWTSRSAHLRTGHPGQHPGASDLGRLSLPVPTTKPSIHLNLSSTSFSTGYDLQSAVLPSSAATFGVPSTSSLGLPLSESVGSGMEPSNAAGETSVSCTADDSVTTPQHVKGSTLSIGSSALSGNHSAHKLPLDTDTGSLYRPQRLSTRVSTSTSLHSRSRKPSSTASDRRSQRQLPRTSDSTRPLPNERVARLSDGPSDVLSNEDAEPAYPSWSTHSQRNPHQTPSSTATPSRPSMSVFGVSYTSEASADHVRSPTSGHSVNELDDLFGPTRSPPKPRPTLVTRHSPTLDSLPDVYPVHTPESEKAPSIVRRLPSIPASPEPANQPWRKNPSYPFLDGKDYQVDDFGLTKFAVARTSPVKISHSSQHRRLPSASGHTPI
ncbi:hypothetical protein FRB99_006929 [Tulasnella sp. 403]|nr:hypothetical protein FRB99_006929 [Tulasnella sp. 403]